MKKGFTIIELIIIITMLLLLTAWGLPYFGNALSKNNVEITALELQSNLRQAQAKALAGEGNSRWGVYISTNYYVLYKGANYISRDVAYDLITPTERQVTLSGLTEVNFTKNKGKPSATGAIAVLGPENQTLQVIINNFGSVNIQ